MSHTLPEIDAYDALRGIWSVVLRQPSAAGQPALFLDRDGLIIEEVDYPRRIEDVRLIPGAAAVIRRANERQVPVVIVTNQAGIGRGIVSWPAFAAVQARLLDDLAAEGAGVDAVMACPLHPEAAPPYRHDHPPARKPGPDMLLRAAVLLALDLGRSWIAGDRDSDVEAGRNAGIAGGIHVLTGHGSDDGERQRALAWARPGFEVREAASIAELTQLTPILRG